VSGDIMRQVAIAIALAVSVGLVACEETSPRGDGGDGDVSVPVDGTSPDRDAGADTGLPDASVPPVGVPHDFCGQDLFVLPIGGTLENVFGINLWDGQLAYSKGPKEAVAWDVYYLDLRTRLEYRLTTDVLAAHPYIRGR